MNGEISKRKLPYVTIVLIVINAVCFFVLHIVRITKGDLAWINYGASLPPLDIQGEYFRLITSAFMHFDITHLANNMIMLYFVGEYVEEALGKIKYIIVYILCALGGNLLSNVYYMLAGKSVVAMGASGAIFGLAGVLAYIIFRNRGHYKGLTVQRMIIFLVLCIYSGISNSGVNNAAHIGGLLTGFLTGLIFYRPVSSNFNCNNPI